MPEIWPNTTWPFSSLTRKVALGRFSRTSPCIWMTSSLDILFAYRIGKPEPLKFAFLSSESYW
ncbi:Uncharacterised protein [Bordetella pertussis]|nr:Uncharacterised protein [Bordetella pertussis]